MVGTAQAVLCVLSAISTVDASSSLYKGRGQARQELGEARRKLYDDDDEPVEPAGGYGGYDVPTVPINCAVSEWGSWSDCSEACGEGVHSRSRKVTTQPEFGGKLCPDLQMNGNCNAGPCALDCKFTWGDWSSCSRECGGGITYREPSELFVLFHVHY